MMLIMMMMVMLEGSQQNRHGLILIGRIHGAIVAATVGAIVAATNTCLIE